MTRPWWPWCLSTPPAARNRPRSWRQPRLARPCLESLEERTLLSVGNLDPRFGAGGILVLDNQANPVQVRQQINDLVVLRDGNDLVPDSILTVGRAIGANGSDSFVSRTESGGTADPDFGAGGTVVFGTGNEDEATAVAVVDPNRGIDRDETIIVGGTVGPAAARDLFIHRFDARGNLLTQFTLDLGGDEVLTDLVALADGSCIAVGTTTQAGQDVFLVRLDATGAIDQQFGDNGRVILALPGDDEANALTVRTNANGSLRDIFVAGSTTRPHPGNASGTHRDFLLIKVTAAGQLDNSFGMGGITTLDFSGNIPGQVAGTAVIPGSSFEDIAHDIAIVKDGAADRIVVTGKASNGRFDFLALARFTEAGALDTTFAQGVQTFGPQGTNTIAVGPSSDIAFALAVQPNGKLAVAGRSLRDEINLERSDFSLARFNANGSIDTTFGLDGRLITPIGVDGFSQARALDFGDNGTLVAAGTVSLPDPFQGNHRIDRAVIARFQADIRPITQDNAFSITTDGVSTPILIVPLDNDFDPDQFDRISITQVRVDPEGTLDADRSDDLFARPGQPVSYAHGTVSTDGIQVRFTPRAGFSGSTRFAYTVSDGWLSTEGFIDVGVVNNGQAGAGDIDPTFGAVPNRVAQLVGFRSSTGNAVARFPDRDEFIVAGTVTTILANGSSRTDIGLARYDLDGNLVTAFGGGQGFVVRDAGLGTNGINLNEDIRAVAFQRVGGVLKIVVAGVIDRDETFDEDPAVIQNDFLLARFEIDGTLDTSFGTQGFKTVSFGGSRDEANALLAVEVSAGNDDLIVAGTSNGTVGAQAATGGLDFALVRLDTSGAEVTTFGTGGKVLTDVATRSEIIRALALQAGKLLAVGTATVTNNGTDFALARYDLATGQLDTGFDGDGIATHNVSQADDLFAVAVEPATDNILVAGYVTPNGSRNIALARFTSNGSIDTTFDGDGVSTMARAGQDEARAILIQNSTIFVGGFVSNASNDSAAPGEPRDFALVRFNQADGAFQSLTATDFLGGNDQIAGLVATANGVLAAGTALESHFLRAHGLARYDNMGVLDTTFAPAGIEGFGVVFRSAGVGDAEAQAVLVQDNGKVLLGGHALVAGAGSQPNHKAFVLARFLTGGGVDSSFGTEGLQLLDLGNGDDQINALLGLPADRFLAAGFTTQDGNRDVVLARFNADGSLDNSFDQDGRLVIDLGGIDEIRAAVREGNSIFLAGHSLQNNRKQLAILKLDQNGVLDNTFGDNGRILLALAEDVELNAIALDAGDVVVAGTIGTGVSADLLLARFTATGDLDPSFNPVGPTPGISRADGGNQRGDVGNALAIDAAGNYLIAGVVENENGDTDFLVARFRGRPANPVLAGVADETFGSGGNGGVILRDLGPGNDRATSLELQTVGGEQRIVIGGVTNFDPIPGLNTPDNGDSFAIVRLLGNGLRDTSLDGSGLVRVAIGSAARINELALSGGQIIAAGASNFLTVVNNQLVAQPQRLTALRLLGSATGNLPPLAVNDRATTARDVAVQIPVLLNDLDGNEDNLTIASFVAPPAAQGTVTIIENGKQLEFTPAVGFTGTVEITYRLSDGSALPPAEARVTVTVVEPPRRDSQTPPPPTSIDRFQDALTDQDGLIASLRFLNLGGPNANGVYTRPVNERNPGADGLFAHLTTGDTSVAEDGSLSGVDNGNRLAGNRTGASDATILELTLNVPQGHNFLSFDFAFLTNEYPGFFGRNANDAFLAELNRSTWTLDPVTGVIQSPDDFAFDVGTLEPISIRSNSFADRRVQTLTGTLYNAGTPFLRAGTPIRPEDIDGNGQVKLYLSIFDVGDALIRGQIDSAVFIEHLQTSRREDLQLLLDNNQPLTDFRGARQAPIAGPDWVPHQGDQPIEIRVLDNDQGYDGTPLRIEGIVFGPSQGTVQINPTTNTITYTPTFSSSSFSSDDAFSYRVVDIYGQESIGEVLISDVFTDVVSATDPLTSLETGFLDSGVLTNNVPGSDPTVFTLALYSRNPEQVPFPSLTYFDVFAPRTGATDRVEIVVNVPAGGGELFYFNGAVWQPVRSSGGQLPISLGNGQFRLVLDSFSFPRVNYLTGTVFTIPVPTPTPTSTGSTPTASTGNGTGSTDFAFRTDVSISFGVTSSQTTAVRSSESSQNIRLNQGPASSSQGSGGGSQSLALGQAASGAGGPPAFEFTLEMVWIMDLKPDVFRLLMNHLEAGGTTDASILQAAVPPGLTLEVVEGVGGTGAPAVPGSPSGQAPPEEESPPSEELDSFFLQDCPGMVSPEAEETVHLPDWAWAAVLASCVEWKEKKRVSAERKV